ncbi:hypothetical protein D3C87_2073910 [compost metagenome]
MLIGRQYGIRIRPVSRSGNIKRLKERPAGFLSSVVEQLFLGCCRRELYGQSRFGLFVIRN